MLELKIFSPQEDGFIQKIDWNFDELKGAIKPKVDEYAAIVYGDDQIKEAKADRAKLNKLVDRIESERKRIKAQCMSPYTAFEKEVKELTGLIKTGISNIDGQIKAYEERQREDKLEKVHQIYAETVPDEMVDFVPFEKVFKDKYLLSGTTLKAVRTDIEELFLRIRGDMAIINGLPEYVFEAAERYKVTLDLSSAMAEVNRLRDAQERKEAFEQQRRQQEAERQKQQEKEAEALKCANRGFVPETPDESLVIGISDKPEERVLTIHFSVTAKESQFDEVNRILMELKRACEEFKIISD